MRHFYGEAWQPAHVARSVEVEEVVCGGILRVPGGILLAPKGTQQQGGVATLVPKALPGQGSWLGQGHAARGARGVLLQPRPQARVVEEMATR